MLKSTLSAGALLLLALTPATAQTTTQELSLADCQSIWSQVGPGAGATMSQADAEDVVADLDAADDNGDGALSRSEFLAACQDGNVRGSAATGADSDND